MKVEISELQISLAALNEPAQRQQAFNRNMKIHNRFHNKEWNTAHMM